ncbi:hypothetical protein BYT27DRAFT_7113546 [Phlegmacium glaucopus]|nr:hypothetical protein BYT27DRAFT_7113546 [Phlegmacium glaucopus]
MVINFSEFKYDPSAEAALIKELVLQVCKVIGPFAVPRKIFIINDLPKTYRQANMLSFVHCM